MLATHRPLLGEEAIQIVDISIPAIHSRATTSCTLSATERLIPPHKPQLAAVIYTSYYSSSVGDELGQGGLFMVRTNQLHAGRHLAAGVCLAGGARVEQDLDDARGVRDHGEGVICVDDCLRRPPAGLAVTDPVVGGISAGVGQGGGGAAELDHVRPPAVVGDVEVEVPEEGGEVEELVVGVGIREGAGGPGGLRGREIRGASRSALPAYGVLA